MHPIHWRTALRAKISVSRVGKTKEPKPRDWRMKSEFQLRTRRYGPF